jgi:COP9 signalosome complex subunit 1
VEALYEQIRHKALIQYTNPFISVDLNTMAAAFKTNVAGLEKELAALIMENQIQVSLCGTLQFDRIFAISSRLTRSKLQNL